MRAPAYVLCYVEHNDPGKSTAFHRVVGVYPSEERAWAVAHDPPRDYHPPLDRPRGSKDVDSEYADITESGLVYWEVTEVEAE